MQEINSYTEQIERLKKQGDTQDFRLDRLERHIMSLNHEVDELRCELTRLSEKIRTAITTILLIIFLSFGAMLIPKLCFGRTVIIGDSHVGGLMPYLKNSMHVRFKNGTTSRYWMRQPKSRADTLFIMTGTNEQFVGIKPNEWLRNTESICNNWDVDNCYIIAPPPNRKRNYRAFWNALHGRKNVIFFKAHDSIDGVHLTPSEYKRIADRLKRFK